MGVQDVTVELECATFVAELEPNAKVDAQGLRNVIERIMILEDKELIELADLPQSLVVGRHPVVSGRDIRSAASPAPLGSMTLDQIERDAIRQALEKSGQNQVRAAKLLGISRDTLRYRMKKFGLLEGTPR